jgi:alanyl-tRNA synthetase
MHAVNIMAGMHCSSSSTIDMFNISNKAAGFKRIVSMHGKNKFIERGTSVQR